MQRISDAIQQGAEAYLARQYKTIAVLAVLVAIVIGVGYGFFRQGMATDPVNDVKVLALYVTLSFLLGAISSGIAGFMGMWISIRANIRTAAAAMDSLNGALQTALRGGAVSFHRIFQGTDAVDFYFDGVAFDEGEFVGGDYACAG